MSARVHPHGTPAQTLASASCNGCPSIHIGSDTYEATMLMRPFFFFNPVVLTVGGKQASNMLSSCGIRKQNVLSGALEPWELVLGTVRLSVEVP